MQGTTDERLAKIEAEIAFLVAGMTKLLVLQQASPAAAASPAEEPAGIMEKGKSKKWRAARWGLARYLASHGPQTSTELAKADVISQGLYYQKAVKDDWFEVDARKLTLSAKGWAAVRGEAPDSKEDDDQGDDDTEDE